MKIKNIWSSKCDVPTLHYNPISDYLRCILPELNVEEMSEADIDAQLEEYAQSYVNLSDEVNAEPKNSGLTFALAGQISIWEAAIRLCQDSNRSFDDWKQLVDDMQKQRLAEQQRKQSNNPFQLFGVKVFYYASRQLLRDTTYEYTCVRFRFVSMQQYNGMSVWLDSDGWLCVMDVNHNTIWDGYLYEIDEVREALPIK